MILKIFIFIIGVNSTFIFGLFLLALEDSKKIKDKLICLIVCVISCIIMCKSYNNLKTIDKEQYNENIEPYILDNSKDVCLVDIDSLMKNTKIFKY